MSFTRGPGSLGHLSLVLSVTPQLFACVPRRLADASLALVHAARTLCQIPLRFGDHTLPLGDHPLRLGHRALAFGDVSLLLRHLELSRCQVGPLIWHSRLSGFIPLGAGIGGIGPHLYTWS